MKLPYRIAYYFFLPIFTYLYKHKVYGLENIPKGKAILAANHTSFLDPPLVGFSVIPEEIYYFAKVELFTNTLLASLFRGLNAIPVVGVTQNIQAIKEGTKLLNKEKKIVIFPEGNRAPDGKLQPLEEGTAMLALKTESPIVPTYIHGSFHVWPRHNSLPGVSGRTSCHFGKPIYPKDFSNLSKKEAKTALTEVLSLALHQLQLVAEGLKRCS